MRLASDLHIQIPKTWQLLLVIACIGLLELAFSIPLLTLALYNNDIALTESYDAPPTINVRYNDLYEE